MQMVNKNEGGFELDIREILLACLSRWKLIVVCVVSVALLMGLVTVSLITPMYNAKVTVYVNNAGRDQKVNYITSTNLEAAQNLVNTYIQIIKSDNVLEKVADAAGLDITAKQIRTCMSASQKGQTEIFEVSIRLADPHLAARIANAVAEVAPEAIESFVEGSSAKVIDYAKVPEAPYSPSLLKNVFVGAFVGGLLAAAYVVLRFLMDVRIKSGEELIGMFDLPVLGQIPDFGSGSQKVSRHRGKAYENDPDEQSSQKAKRLQKAKGKKTQNEQDNIISSKSDFFIREAYKSLRTNVSFTLTGEEKSKVIVVTSSMQGEGKSITAVNLAVSYTMTDKKVLMIDCDMRRPKLARLLQQSAKVGLSNLIMDPALLPEAVCHTDIKGLDVILAGSIPPNPSELLGSARMQNLLEMLRDSYDYIFLDLPPVNMVTDAVVLAPKSDGVLFLVRANQSERDDVINAVRQLGYAKTKILGFILNDADLDKGHYGRGKYYKRYSKYSYAGYGAYSSYVQHGEESRNEVRKESENA